LKRLKLKCQYHQKYTKKPKLYSTIANRYLNIAILIYNPRSKWFSQITLLTEKQRQSRSYFLISAGTFMIKRNIYSAFIHCTNLLLTKEWIQWQSHLSLPLSLSFSLSLPLFDIQFTVSIDILMAIYKSYKSMCQFW
jgi:hypothetical protein